MDPALARLWLRGEGADPGEPSALARTKTRLTRARWRWLAVVAGPVRVRPAPDAHVASYLSSVTSRAGRTAMVGPKLVMYCRVWLWWAVICSALSFSLSSVECASDTSTTS